MKKLLVVVVAIVLCTLMVVGCAAQPAASGSAAPSESASAEATTASSESAAPAASTGADASKTFKIGFAQRTQDNPFFVALAAAFEAEAKSRGWEPTILDAKNSLEDEIANMQTFITQGVDLILIECVDQEGSVPAVQQAMAAGIPVIEIDAPLSNKSGKVTEVSCNNRGNGRLVGLYAAENCYDKDTLISAVLISGDKGNLGAQDRRVGLIAGIIQGRTGKSEEEAFTAAEAMEQELIDNGKAKSDEANFEIRGQGWAQWTAENGLTQMEDLLVANPDINCLLGENDDMLFGAMEALKAAGKLEQVQIFSAADGSTKTLDMIKEGGAYKAVGQNSPTKVMALAYQVADELLVDGKDPKSYPEFTATEPYAITPDNVDESYADAF